MTLAEIATNIEAKHDRCSGYEACACFERLLAATRGEPDPDGEHYRWPIYEYGCAEAPQYGPPTATESAMAAMNQRLAEAAYRNMELTMGTIEGLDHALSVPVIVTGYKGAES